MYEDSQGMLKITPVSLAYQADVYHTEKLSWVIGPHSTGQVEAKLNTLFGAEINENQPRKKGNL